MNSKDIETTTMPIYIKAQITMMNLIKKSTENSFIIIINRIYIFVSKFFKGFVEKLESLPEKDQKYAQSELEKQVEEHKGETISTILLSF